MTTNERRVTTGTDNVGIGRRTVAAAILGTRRITSEPRQIGPNSWEVDLSDGTVWTELGTGRDTIDAGIELMKAR